MQRYQLVNLGSEHKERASRVSEHLPIIPVCYGRGIDSLAMLKATSGVQLNNERSHDQRRNCIEDMHHETLKSPYVTCDTRESATTRCVAKITSNPMQRFSNPISHSTQIFRIRKQHDTNETINQYIIPYQAAPHEVGRK